MGGAPLVLSQECGFGPDLIGTSICLGAAALLLIASLVTAILFCWYCRLGRRCCQARCTWLSGSSRRPRLVLPEVTTEALQNGLAADQLELQSWQRQQKDQ